LTDWFSSLSQPNEPKPKTDWVGQIQGGDGPLTPQQTKETLPKGRTIIDDITGKGEYEFDLPELPLSGAIPAGKVALARDDAGKIDIIRKSDPEAKFGQDSFGNAIVVTGGKSYYLNRPGVSQSDVLEVVADAPFMLLGGVGGGAAGRALTGLGRKTGVMAGAGRVAGTGIGTGVGSVARDVAAGMAGSEQGVDPGAAVTAAVFGSGGELAAPLVSWAFRKVSPKVAVLDATGKPTPEAVQEVSKALGIDASALGGDFWGQFQKLAKDAIDPAAAARSAQAQSLPVPVPLSRGDVSGLASEQMTESLMRKGAYGKPAELQMRGFRDEQQEALRGNVPAIQNRLSGQAQVVEPGQGVAKAQASLVGKEAIERKNAGELFTQARQTSAGIDQANALQGAFNIRSAVAQGHTLEGLKRTNAVLDDFDNLVTGRDKSVTVNALFDWRKRATAAANDPGEEGVAIRKAINGFDEWVGKSLDDALFSGDPNAIGAWKDAIDNYRQFSGRFKGGDAIEALTEKTSRSGERTLKVAPEDAANYLLGRSTLSFLSKPNFTRDLNVLKRELPPDDWNAVREEVFLRFVNAGEGAMEANKRMFSGPKFAKAWESANRQAPAVMSNLFSTEERNLISQFSDVAAKATGRVAGGDNYSNTVPGAANVMQMIASRLPFSRETVARALFGANVLGVGDFAGTVLTRGATKGMPAKKMLPPGFSGGVAATAQ